MQVKHDGNSNTTYFFRSVVDAKDHNHCAMVIFEDDVYIPFFEKEPYPGQALKIQNGCKTKEEAYNLVEKYIKSL